MAEAKRPATPADVLDGYALPGIQRPDPPLGVPAGHPGALRRAVVPGGRTPEELGRYLQTTEQGWGQGVALPFLAPTTAGDQSFKRWFA